MLITKKEVNDMEKIKIQKNTVMETFVLPLYGRAYCSENQPFHHKKNGRNGNENGICKNGRDRI